MEINICPDWVLVKLGVPLQARTHFAYLLSTLAALALAPVLIHVPHICLMRSLLGLPCPGCGVLNAVAAIMHGHLAAGWRANPGGAGLAMLFGFQISARPVAIVWGRANRFVSCLSRHGSQAVVALLMVVWLLRLICGGL